MPKRIDSLTPEQAARFAEWSKQWIDIGLSTEPADFDKVTEAALRGYQLANLKPPMVVLRMSSPYGATLGGALAWAMLRGLSNKKMESRVGAQVGGQVGAQVRDQVGAQVWDQVGAQVWDQVGDQVRDQVGAQLRDAHHNSLYAQHDAGLGAWVTFFRDVCGWENESLSKFEVTETLIKTCGWTWWHENVLAISDRPSLLNRDEQGRLHSETGPAIAYRDGWSLYYWHGVSVPAEWIEKRATLDPALVLKASNVEQRAAGASIVGWPKMVNKLKRKVIDGDPNTDMGALIELTLPGLSEPGRFLQAKCPRNGIIVEGVPRVSDIDNLPINTVIAAQAWRVGDPQSEYEHPPVRS